MKLLNWFRRRTLENDLDRELNYHIDRRVSDLIQAGLTEPEARRQVALELGGSAQIREEVRDVWLTRWLRDLAYDLRFSARSFLRSPSFTTTAVLSLALGIGATAAIYSLLDQVVLHSLPVREPHRLVVSSIGVAIPADRNTYGYLSEHHSFGETEEQAGEYAEELAAEMLATTLNVEFDPDDSWDEKKEIYRISNKIVRTSNITQSAVGDKRGLWTTTIAAAVLILDED